jgi:hypothetical protein
MLCSIAGGYLAPSRDTIQITTHARPGWRLFCPELQLSKLALPLDDRETFVSRLLLVDRAGLIGISRNRRITVPCSTFNVQLRVVQLEIMPFLFCLFTFGISYDDELPQCLSFYLSIPYTLYFQLHTASDILRLLYFLTFCPVVPRQQPYFFLRGLVILSAIPSAGRYCARPSVLFFKSG